MIYLVFQARFKPEKITLCPFVIYYKHKHFTIIMFYVPTYYKKNSTIQLVYKIQII